MLFLCTSAVLVTYVYADQDIAPMQVKTNISTRELMNGSDDQDSESDLADWRRTLFLYGS